MVLLILKCAACLLLVAAAYIDARSRLFPNELALALAFVSAACALCSSGAVYCAIALARAAVFCAALFGFEALWRRYRGSSGIGMGDLKATFSLLVLSFRAGVAGFCVGLALLAVACVARRADSMPALPFIVPSFLVLWVVLGL